MDKLVELNREYWGRIHDMCAGTNVKPWKCVQYKVEGKWYSYTCNPVFEDLEKNEKIRFAVAILEDKVVFVGDVIYRKKDGFKVRVDGLSGCSKHGFWVNLDFDNKSALWTYKGLSEQFTWHPPKPKRTFTLNGVELPCPVPINKSCPGLPQIDISGSFFYYSNIDDFRKVTGALIDLFTEARDKE